MHSVDLSLVLRKPSLLPDGVEGTPEQVRRNFGQPDFEFVTTPEDRAAIWNKAASRYGQPQRNVDENPPTVTLVYGAVSFVFDANRRVLGTTMLELNERKLTQGGKLCVELGDLLPHSSFEDVAHVFDRSGVVWSEHAPPEPDVQRVMTVESGPRLFFNVPRRWGPRAGLWLIVWYQ